MKLFSLSHWSYDPFKKFKWCNDIYNIRNSFLGCLFYFCGSINWIENGFILAIWEGTFSHLPNDRQPSNFKLLVIGIDFLVFLWFSFVFNSLELSLSKAMWPVPHPGVKWNPFFWVANMIALVGLKLTPLTRITCFF